MFAPNLARPKQSIQKIKGKILLYSWFVENSSITSAVVFKEMHVKKARGPNYIAIFDPKKKQKHLLLSGRQSSIPDIGTIHTKVKNK